MTAQVVAHAEKGPSQRGWASEMYRTRLSGTAQLSPHGFKLLSTVD